MAEIPRADNVVVERQRIAIADAENPSAVANVDGERGRGHALVTDDAALKSLLRIENKLEELIDLLHEFVHS